MNSERQCATHTRLNLLGLIVTLGIVYGDIGTSPLYVMKAILSANASPDVDYIIGAVSCIIWTLTLQTTIKYVLIALRADNKGEGGILALYALVRKNKHKWLYGIAIVGASTLIADGVITPSITVLSAIEGLKGIEPSTPVVPISIAIITVLFFIQQFGTNILGKSFGPIMFLWFSMLGILGAFHLAEYWPILKAFNPYYAVNLLIHFPDWFLILGAVFLCTTGAEALYSDLGHCGINNIRISWIFVKATLILNYLGQGAWIISHLDTITTATNPFYAIMPRDFVIFGVVIATAAAIIASQALISGSFTIFSEAMNLNFWPRQKISYPTNIMGQLYIPRVNLTLFVLCIVAILLFQTSGNMEAAYGLSITFTMLMTTILLVSYLRHKKVSYYFLIPFAILFIGIETSFLLANLFKFIHGGWFTILIAGMISFVMFVWYNARNARNRQLQFAPIEPYYSIISDIKRDETIPKYATNLIFLSKTNNKNDIESKIIYSIINKQPKRADHYWILHVEYQDSPDIREYSFSQLIPNTLFYVDLKLGFRINPSINLFLRQIIEDLTQKKEFNLTSTYPSLRKHNIPGDFRFVIINRINSHENALHLKGRFVMKMYSILSFLEISVQNAFGLDTSNITVEDVPLIMNKRNVPRLTRVD